MVYVRNINNINLQNTKRASNFIDMVDNRQGWINRVKTYVSSQFICFSINNHNWELFPPATGWTKRRPGCSLTLEIIWWLGEWSSVGAFTGMAITFNNLYTGCPKNVTVVFYHKGRGAWTEIKEADLNLYSTCQTAKFLCPSEAEIPNFLRNSPYLGSWQITKAILVTFFGDALHRWLWKTPNWTNGKWCN